MARFRKNDFFKWTHKWSVPKLFAMRTERFKTIRYPCPGTPYYKHYGQTARTVQPALRQIFSISKPLNTK